MRLLITGANGQLGCELREVLKDGFKGEVFYTDAGSLDITNEKAVRDFVASHDLTHIVNCAAYTAVDKAETESAKCYMINSEGVKNLAKISAEYGIKMLHVSTDYVFDGENFKPYHESDTVNPVSIYGLSKRKGEMMLLSLNSDSIIIRTAWLYSSYGNNFVKTMLRLAKDAKHIRVVGDQIGSPTYAADLAQAIKNILTSPQWISGTYHFTDQGACSRYDFTKIILRFAGISDCRVDAITSEDFPTAARRPYYSVLDCTLIKRTYGIAIPHWVDSLERCINKLKETNQI